MNDKFSKLLKKSEEKSATEKKPLASKIVEQFEKAEQIMEKISSPENLNKEKQIKPKVIYVSYALPESYIETVTQIRKSCMRNDVEINKSEIIKIGIDLVSKLSVDDLSDLVEHVRVPRGRPKE